MAKKNRRWEKLDNTANIFPVVANRSLTNTYRIAVELTEPVDEVLLQEAVDLVTARFPGFRQRLRAGIFWYYFEENDKPAPRVHMENTFPCRSIPAYSNNNYMFRVTWYRNRINLEVFHALADGMGGITFLREITFQYLRLAHPDLRKKLSDDLSPDTSLDREDSFLSHYRKAHRREYKSTPAFLIRGEKLPYMGFAVVHGEMSVAQLKQMCREKYGVSINEYLVAAFVYSTWKNYRAKIRPDRPVRVAVPVNLRPYFPSITTKNFFAMVSAEFSPEPGKDYSFAEICAITHDSLKQQITPENLEAVFSYNVSNEQLLIARAVPLVFKNMVMRIVYNQSALANTTTITNIGRIDVADEYAPYVRRFVAFLSFSKGQGLKGTICSYKDRLVYTFSTMWAENGVIRDVFRQIASDGVDVCIETNGIWDSSTDSPEKTRKSRKQKKARKEAESGDFRP